MRREKSKFTIEMPIIRMNHDSALVIVTSKSPKKHRVAVEQIARYFQREMHYDFVQYSSRSDDAIAYVFTDNHTINITDNDKWDLQSIGAACFRELLYEGYDYPVMTLDWIWIHPYERNQNIVSDFFNRFIDDLGYFFISQPISSGMLKLLDKLDYPLQFEKIIERIENSNVSITK